jgi:predicted DNA-binding ribbon-helix-helix protein
MKSLVIKRSIVVAGHKTSVSLEDPFWNALKEIAGGRNMTLSNLIGAIDAEREHGNLSSAIRLLCSAPTAISSLLKRTPPDKTARDMGC